MPLIQCHIAKGLSPEKKRKLVDDLVEATHRTLGADRKVVAVIVHEHDKGNLRELGAHEPPPR